MIYGHIHNQINADYWPLIAKWGRMLNAAATRPFNFNKGTGR